MKASELIAELKKWINIDGDLDVEIFNEEGNLELVGLAKPDDGSFLLCDDDSYNLLYAGGEEDEESEIATTEETEELI